MTPPVAASLNSFSSLTALNSQTYNFEFTVSTKKIVISTGFSSNSSVSILVPPNFKVSSFDSLLQ